MRTTGIGGSLALITIGAILAFAVSVETEGFSINTAGIIMLVVGIVGLIASIAMGSMPTRNIVESEERTVTVDR